jgi:hypothetical protein
MFTIESIPFASKSGWVTETIPMVRRQAEALLKARIANATGKRRFRLVKVN